MEELEVIAGKIQRLAGRPPFMLDRDLAEIYETSASRINQVVKRNPKRFPKDFCFKLTRMEMEECLAKAGTRGVDKEEMDEHGQARTNTDRHGRARRGPAKG